MRRFFPGIVIASLAICSQAICFESMQNAVLEKSYEEPDNSEIRTYQDISIDCGRDGKAHFTISLPKEVPSKGLPCVVIVGGLMTGRESLRFIPHHGKYALAAYEYPEALKKLREIKALWNLYSIRKAMLEVPRQIVGIIKYLESCLWSDEKPVNLMGYSFGSTFIPASYVAAEEDRVRLGPGVMAYGGAGIYCIVYPNLSFPNFLRKPVAELAAALFKPIDPLFCAPKMKGEFLIINGTGDRQIPSECAHRLQSIVPEPKTIINLDTKHLSPENNELTLYLIKISRDWLDKKRKNP